MQSKGLGLLIAPDPRDENYPMRLRAPAVSRRTKRWAYFDAPLDQGNTGTCVGHAAKHFLSAAPIIQSDVFDRPTPIELYLLACKLDQWPDNDYGDLQFGTSMNAMGQALRQLGYITEWQHAYTVDAVADALAGIDAEGEHVGGPVMLGLPWKSGMFETDSEGFIHATGRTEGGHAITALLWNESAGEIWGPNSWGGRFGKPHPLRGRDGYWRMSGETLETLLREDGEAIICQEVRE